MVNGVPDPARFFKFFGDLIVTVAEAAKGEKARVAVFGEGVQLLCSQGNAEAAIRVERLTNRIANTCDVDILCRLFAYRSGRDGQPRFPKNP